jgi:hypothetical protein
MTTLAAFPIITSAQFTMFTRHGAGREETSIDPFSSSGITEPRCPIESVRPTDNSVGGALAC